MRVNAIGVERTKRTTSTKRIHADGSIRRKEVRDIRMEGLRKRREGQRARRGERKGFGEGKEREGA